jgi:hypothetical protein
MKMQLSIGNIICSKDSTAISSVVANNDTSHEADAIPMRVVFSSKDFDSVKCDGHELFFTDVNTPTVQSLSDTIRDHFLKIKEGNIKSRSSIPECSVWGLGYHADRIKAIWDTGPEGCEFDSVLLCESIITDTTSRLCLRL